MLGSIRRWFSGTARPAGWQAVQQWAVQAGHGFKRTRSGNGFVVEPRAPGGGWRLEWGTSQRVYIGGAELRLRARVGGGEKLQLLVVSRSLMEQLEKQVFEQFTEGLQTRADTDTPEEMRWLVLFPQSASFASKSLREGFGGAANAPPAFTQWVDGPLSAALEQAAAGWLRPAEPFALILQRGRLTMRLSLPAAEVARIDAASALFEVALREARRMAEAWGPSGAQTTQPSLWSASAVDSRGPPDGE